MEKDEMKKSNEKQAGGTASDDDLIMKENGEVTSVGEMRPKSSFEHLLQACYIPDGEEHDHKREQIYLMDRMNRSERFAVQFTRKAPTLDSMQIDMIRSASWFVDEEVLLRKVNVNEVTPETIGKIIADAFKEMEPEKADANAGQAADKTKKEENSPTRKEEHVVIEANGSGVERLDTYYRWMMEMTQKIHEQEMERISAQHKETIMQHRIRERMLEEENFRLSGETEGLKKEQKRREQMEQNISPLPPYSGTRRGIPLFGRGRAARMERERDAFVNEVLSNPSFTSGQMEIIQRVVVSAMPLDQIRNICKPELPIANMLLLEKYYQKRNAEGR